MDFNNVSLSEDMIQIFSQFLQAQYTICEQKAQIKLYHSLLIQFSQPASKQPVHSTHIITQYVTHLAPHNGYKDEQDYKLRQ